MNTRTGLAPRTLPVHLMGKSVELLKLFLFCRNERVCSSQVISNVLECINFVFYSEKTNTNVQKPRPNFR